MLRPQVHFLRGCSSQVRILAAVFLTTLSLDSISFAVELPPDLPLWERGSPEEPIRHDVEEQVRSVPAPAGSPSGLNRAFSSVSSPTYSIHRPERPNGVGLVICPGGGFRDVWIDREGHDLAIRLKEHGVTSLVLKYRTRPAEIGSKDAWLRYQNAVQADGRQAIRILRRQAKDLGLDPSKIGICGFSAGGHLAISCTLYSEPKTAEPTISSMPDFTGLFYPGIPEGALEAIASRAVPQSQIRPIGPVFIVNARVDEMTPVDKCLEFYTALLKAGVNAELHVFSKGGHGFGLGDGRGESAALWPRSVVAWLHDVNMIRSSRCVGEPPVSIDD
jgi:acetyl esterase/lipase